MVRNVTLGNRKIDLWLFGIIVGLLIVIILGLANLGAFDFTKTWRGYDGPRHAEQNHSDVVGEIRHCLNQNGAHQVWRRIDKRTNRQTFIELCQLPNDDWGMMVKGLNGEEITAFVKEAATWIGTTNYLVRAGYTRFTGELPY